MQLYFILVNRTKAWKVIDGEAKVLTSSHTHWIEHVSVNECIYLKSFYISIGDSDTDIKSPYSL